MKAENAPRLDPNGPHSAIYIAARQEWNERYGGYIAQAAAWRVTAIASLALAAVAVVGLAWEASQNHIVPYVVQTDKLGDAVAISRADIAAPASPALIRAQLANWISNTRSVYTDAAAEKRIVTEAYALVNGRSRAAAQLNDWFSAHNPFERARNDIVTVAVESVQPISGNTWRIEWREDTASRTGSGQSSQEWQATVTVSVNPPTTAAEILANPVGLYIDNYFWSERT